MTTPFPTDTGEAQGHRAYATAQLSSEAKTFNWLLDSFTSGTAGVGEAIAVSSDGLRMAMSSIQDRANAERLAAVVSGLTSLAGGAATWYSLGGLNRVIIDMAQGYLLVTTISSGSAPAPAGVASTMTSEGSASPRARVDTFPVAGS